MAASDKELEKQLTEAGNKLLDPPSSVEELLCLLDRVEECLSKVEQSPPDSMQNALSPLMKALIADKLFKHSDVDVKVAVAACISEITRITAPDAPYDDDQMKEVFQLIVSSFENLVDKSSRSYAKRTSILETVAKVRSCVVMLDLECDALIIEMFQHFLKAIRDHHPENVFSSMETIMTLVLEESEDVPPELLSPILDYVKKDDEVLQVSRKLAERVLKNCATKLKPYLTEAVKSLGLSLDNYSNLVTSICQGTFGDLEQNDIVANEKDGKDNLAREPAAEEKQKAPEVSTAQQADVNKDGSLRSEVSNGIAQITENDSLADSDSTKKHEDRNVKDEPRKTDKLIDTDMDDTGAEKVADGGQEQEQTTKKKGKQPSSAKQVESSKTSYVDEGTESETPPDSKDGGKDVPSSPPRDSSVNASISAENEKETTDQALLSRPLEDETAKITSPSQSENLPAESRSKKAVNQKKKDSFTKEAKPSADKAAKVASEEPSDSEAKLTKKSGKKVASSSKTKPTVAAKKSTSEAKPAKQSGKKAVDSDKKKQGRGKAIDEKEASEISSGDDEKPVVSSSKSAPKSSKDEEQPLEETPKTNAKRKRSLGKEKVSDVKKYGEDLVGSRIKVWWPADRAFYEGVVDSYDAAKKKHLVLYDDGDQEILNLKREKWELIEDESESTEDKEAEQTGPGTTSGTPQKKKAKTGGDQSAKQTKADTSAKKGSGATSSKSKAALATKSGKKSKEDEKTESKQKDTSKATSKPEDESSEESQDDGKLKHGGKAAASKSGSKSKKEEVATSKSGKSKAEMDSGTSSKASSKKKEGAPKSSSKSKAEPAKLSSAAKGKTGKTSGKSNNVNGIGKSKSTSGGGGSGSSKAKESEGDSDADVDADADAEDAPKAAETSSKGKSAGSAKAQGKSGKKRKR